MLKNIKKIGIGLLIAQFFGIINQLLIGRLFNPEYLGVYNLAIQISAISSLLLFFRREYFIVEIKNKIQAFYYINYSLLIGLKRLIPIFLLVCLINYNIKFLETEILFFGLSFGVLLCYSTSLQQVFNMKQAFIKSGLTEAIQKFSFSLLLLLFSFLSKYNTYVNFISLSFVIAVSIRIIYSLYFLGELRIPKYRNRIKYYSNFKHITTKGIILSKNNGIAVLTGVIPTLFIAKYYSTEDLGNFVMAVTLLSLPTSLIGNAVSQVLFEHLSAYKEKFHFEEIKKILAILSFTSFAFLILYFFGEELIIDITLGEKWRDSLSYIYILIPSFMLSYISKPFDRSCYYLGKPNWPIISAVIKLSLILISIIICIFFNYDFMFYVKLYCLATSAYYLIDFLYNYNLIIQS